jgi:hypothetical protein
MVFCMGQDILRADQADGIHLQFDKYVVEGRLVEGQRELKKLLTESPGDDQTRFALGILQFVGSVEHLAQALYQYGAGTHEALNLIPFVRLPVPANPSPDKIRYADVRRMLQNLIDDLAEAEKTLQPCGDKSLKLRLPLGNMRLDVNGNGQAEANELLWTMYARVAFRQGQGNASQPAGDQLQAMLDIGDVHWLRGYCNLISAMCNTFLIYDHQKFFDAIAPAIFAKPDVPTSSFFSNKRNDRNYDYFADLIAGIHMDW